MHDDPATLARVVFRDFRSREWSSVAHVVQEDKEGCGARADFQRMWWSPADTGGLLCNISFTSPLLL